MSALLGAGDAISIRQALIVGQITDALTGRAPRTMPAIRLTYQSDPSRAYPLEGRVQANGLFSFSGDSGRAFSPLDPGETLDLRLTAGAGGYEDAVFDFSLAEADLAQSEELREVAGQQHTVALYAAPLVDRELALAPEPLHLAGRVVDADNAAPVAAAAVEITAPEARPAVTTGDDGFFTIHTVPVALALTVRVSHGDFQTLETEILLDYEQVVNRHLFALEPA